MVLIPNPMIAVGRNQGVYDIYIYTVYVYIYMIYSPDMYASKFDSTIPQQQRTHIICRLAPSSTIWSTLQFRSQGLEAKATKVFDQLVWCLGCILFRMPLPTPKYSNYWFTVHLGSPAATLVESLAVWIP